MMLIGALALWTGSFFYLLADSFLAFLAGEIVFGFGFSCMSGADEALFYDSLVELGESEAFSKGWASVGMTGAAYTAFASVTGGWLASFDILYPSMVETVLTAALPLIVMGLSEPRRKADSTKGRSTTGFWDLKELASECLSRRADIRFLIVYPVILMALCQVGLWYYQPYLELCGYGLAQIGFIFAGMQIVFGLSSQTAPMIDRALGLKFRLLAPVLAISAGSLFMGSYVTLGGAVFLLLHQWARGFVQIAYAAPLNELIPSDKRATIISLKSMVYRVVYMFLLFPLSLMGKDKPDQMLMFLGCLVLLVALPALLMLTGRFSLKREVPVVS